MSPSWMTSFSPAEILKKAANKATDEHMTAVLDRMFNSLMSDPSAESVSVFVDARESVRDLVCAELRRLGYRAAVSETARTGGYITISGWHAETKTETGKDGPYR